MEPRGPVHWDMSGHRATCQVVPSAAPVEDAPSAAPVGGTKCCSSGRLAMVMTGASCEHCWLFRPGMWQLHRCLPALTPTSGRLANLACAGHGWCKTSLNRHPVHPEISVMTS